MKNFNLKIIALLIALVIIGAIFVFLKFSKKESLDFSQEKKEIILNDDGLIFKAFTKTNSIEDFLKEKGLALNEHDLVFPDLKSHLFFGQRIEIIRAAEISIEADGKRIEVYALGKNVEEALRENGIVLSRLDKTNPARNFPVADGDEIIVTRINVEKVMEKEYIDFKTVIRKDSDLGWREKKIETKGEKGEKEVLYEITYENGKEVSRKILEAKNLKDPVTQVEIQGTYVKLGDSHKGQGTWYSYRGGLYAASPWLPMGSYAKVTNTDNNKSVIVQINDRGPFGEGRIIDLDKVAFQKIASLGAGVINVKVEEVLN